MLEIIVTLLVTTSAIVEPAKILGIFPTASQSHFSLGFRLMKELADRGHQVHVLSPFPQENAIENYTDIPLQTTKHALDDFRHNFFERENLGPILSTMYIHNMAYALTEAFLQDKSVQSLLKSDEKFDLIIMEYFMNEAALGIASVLKTKVILLSTLPSSALSNHLAANPAPSAYVPNILTDYTGIMRFCERMHNWYYNTFTDFYKAFYVLPQQGALLKKYIDSEMEIDKQMWNIQLILLNSHPTVTGAMPHMPNMIEIGGFHIGPTHKLPHDLQQWMDAAVDGVVLFSMGSNLEVSDMDEIKIQAIKNTFKKLKQNVLWKFKGEQDNLPANVKLVDSIPQQDILGCTDDGCKHPKHYEDSVNVWVFTLFYHAKSSARPKNIFSFKGPQLDESPCSHWNNYLTSQLRLLSVLVLIDIIFSHPNTKVLITHGGLLSVIEAVYFGIPMLGIPIYGDQKSNIAHGVSQGYAVLLPYQEITEETFSKALNAVIESDVFSSIAQNTSLLLRDQVVPPLESAIYWIEYSLRYKWVDQLRSSGVYLNFYRRHMIDIIVVLVVIDIILFLIFYYIFKHIIHHIVKKIKNSKGAKYEKLDEKSGQ